MKQSRSTSLIKSLVSTAVGFAVAFIANMIVMPWFGLELSHSANLLLTCIYTVISIARGYLLERGFEWMGWRTRMSAFALAVLAERQRQIEVEGWAHDHDDDHDTGALARAGAAYAVYAPWHINNPPLVKGIFASALAIWPWEKHWWKPTDFRRDLVKGAALILAEGERHDRSRKRRPQVTEQPSSARTEVA